MRTVFWVLVVAVLAFAGCKKAEPTPTAGVGLPGPAAGGPRDMDGTNRLALGTLKLEGTKEAVTPAQAAELLPLWEIVQGGALQGDAETQAVLKQIEGTMTEAQLTAIEGMELTWQDMGAWMQEQGTEMPARPEGQQGGPGGFQDMTDEERAKMREEFQNMTAEQRATRMAEMGFERPEGSAPGGGQGLGPGGRTNRGGAGRFNVLLDPLIELLKERAAQ
jgi:hypothetical protein